MQEVEEQENQIGKKSLLQIIMSRFFSYTEIKIKDIFYLGHLKQFDIITIVSLTLAHEFIFNLKYK